MISKKISNFFGFRRFPVILHGLHMVYINFDEFYMIFVNFLCLHKLSMLFGNLSTASIDNFMTLRISMI